MTSKREKIAEERSEAENTNEIISNNAIINITTPERGVSQNKYALYAVIIILKNNSATTMTLRGHNKRDTSSSFQGSRMLSIKEYDFNQLRWFLIFCARIINGTGGTIIETPLRKHVKPHIKYHRSRTGDPMFPLPKRLKTVLAQTGSQLQSIYKNPVAKTGRVVRIRVIEYWRTKPRNKVRVRSRSGDNSAKGGAGSLFSPGLASCARADWMAGNAIIHTDQPP